MLSIIILVYNKPFIRRSVPLTTISTEWTEITTLQSQVLEKIENMDTEFSAIEQQRSNEIKKTLQNSRTKLTENAYQPSNNCNEIIQIELLNMNQSIIQNQRRILLLKQKCLHSVLLEGFNVEKEFDDHRSTWKELQIKKCIQVFRDFINSSDAKNPPLVYAVQNDIIKNQAEVLTERQVVFDELKTLHPPHLTKGTIYDWFKKIRTPQDNLEMIYKSSLVEMHAAFANSEQLIKKKYSTLFEQLYEIKADDDLMHTYGDIFSSVVEERVDSYHDQLKYMEQNIRDFFDKSQKQLFKFKNFLVGLATIWEHHVESYDIRMTQFQTELDVMNNEQTIKETVAEDGVMKITQEIKDETTEGAIDEHLKVARQLMIMKNENHKTHCRQRNTVTKMHPNLIDYELKIYDIFLHRFMLNGSREWKIMDLWEFDVDSSYECREMPSDSRKYLTVWLKLLDKRRRRRGQVCPRVADKPEIAPRDRQRIIVKNYYKKRAPQRMCMWWFQETRNQRKGLNKVKKFSRQRFASIVRRNSHQLNKGKIDSLVNQLGDKIKSSEAVPQYMRKSAILDKDIEEMIKHIKGAFFNHYEEYRKQKLESAQDNADKEIIMNEFDLRKKLRLNEPRINYLETEVGAARCAELQMQRDRMVERQKTIANCLNEMKVRKEEVLEEQNAHIEKLEQISLETEPKMQNATKASQLIDIRDQANDRFDAIKDSITDIVKNYAEWSSQKLEEIKIENKKCIRGLKNKVANKSKEPLRKMETLMNKAFFLYNKEIEFTLPEKLKEVIEAKRLFHETKYIPHEADLKYLEQMERAITSSQIQLSSEMSKTARRLLGLEGEIDNYVDEVAKYDKIENCQNADFVKFITNYKQETNLKLSDIVDHFNCRTNVLKMPRREFYSNWLSGRCHQQSQQSSESSHSLHPDVGNTKRKSTMRLRSTVNALGSVLMRARPSNMGTMNMGDRKASKIGMGMTRRIIRDPKTECKIAIFGESKPPPGDDFQCRMTRLLFEATDKLLSLAETYYKHRGVRPITRPNLIRDSFERTCDFTMFKMIDFERKSKDFCAKCFIDILRIVQKFSSSSKDIMRMIFFETQKIHTEDVACEIYSVQKRYQRLFDALDDAGNEHHSKIRTSLGHPENKEELAQLEKRERDRQFKMVKGRV